MKKIAFASCGLVWLAAIAGAQAAKGSFRVMWDGKPIPGIVSISGLRWKTEPVVHRRGGDSNAVRVSPGRTRQEPLVLKRVRTADTEFERWANKVFAYQANLGAEVSLK